MTQHDEATDADTDAGLGGARRSILLIGLAVLILAGAFLWWRSDRSGAEVRPTLLVGDQRGGIQALLKAAGELDDVPYRIDWALFPAASPLLEALSSGAVDLGGVGGAPFAFAYAGGAPIKVVFATRTVSGNGGKASAIVVRRDSPIRSLADLRGKRVATVRGSAGQNLVLRLLEKERIGFDEVNWTYLQNGEAKAALAAGSVDAWSTRHPPIPLQAPPWPRHSEDKSNSPRRSRYAPFQAGAGRGSAPPNRAPSPRVCHASRQGCGSANPGAPLSPRPCHRCR